MIDQLVALLDNYLDIGSPIGRSPLKDCYCVLNYIFNLKSVG